MRAISFIISLTIFLLPLQADLFAQADQELNEALEGFDDEDQSGAELQEVMDGFEGEDEIPTGGDTGEKNEQEISSILEQMADKGLCLAGEFGGTSFYGITPLDNIISTITVTGAAGRSTLPRESSRSMFSAKKPVYVVRGKGA